jgi:hypothetical protein
MGNVMEKTTVYKNFLGQTVVKTRTPDRPIASHKDDLHGKTSKVTFDKDSRDLTPGYLDSLAGKQEPVSRQATKRAIERDLLRDKRKRDYK